ncbi:MAG: anhydro-N-acetylmuramic acid kinase [Planctomycetota bacterium]|nr:anhydro-N-acetylmuramic acid kinase [Planctomycetota bacterium]
MSKRLLLGMGSGTSADGLDFALLAIRGEGTGKTADLLERGFRPYSTKLQAAVLRANKWTVSEVADYHFQLGQWMGNEAQAFLSSIQVSPQELLAIGSHGQTIFHHDGNRGGTLQLGDISVIAESAGAPVVGDFRWSDLAAGGEGAPISPYADWVLHRHHAPRLAILNWGGLGNITLLEGDSPPKAWDTGPANGPLDALCRLETDLSCDFDGKLGLSGKVREDLLEHLKAEPFFERDLPRSTGLEIFGLSFAKKMRAFAPSVPLRDLLATAAEISAWCVSDSLRRANWRGGDLFLAGGGAHNPCMVKALERGLSAGTTLRQFSDLGWDSDSREAAAFALLADAFLLGEPTSWPTTTGVSQPTVLGKWVPRPNS